MANDKDNGANSIEQLDLENADGYVASATKYVCKPGEHPLDIVATRVSYMVPHTLSSWDYTLISD